MVTQVVRHKQKWVLQAFLDVVKEEFATSRATVPKDRNILRNGG
jgi:hypothetical protein